MRIESRSPCGSPTSRHPECGAGCVRVARSVSVTIMIRVGRRRARQFAIRPGRCKATFEEARTQVLSERVTSTSVPPL